ncbi:hypothetical protein WKT02_11710 [Erysipelotrichaceae bacterium HCN-30851]
MNNTEYIERLRSYKNISFIGGCVLGIIFLCISIKLFSVISDITGMFGGYGEELNVLPVMVLLISGICFLFAFTSRIIFKTLLNENTIQSIDTEEKEATIDELKI